MWIINLILDPCPKWGSQGSCPAGILFLLFIGDLGEDITPLQANISKYVYDTLALRGVSSEKEVEELQVALEALYRWQANNNMTYNQSKFQVLTVGKNSSLKEDTLLFTRNMEDVISPASSAKDLGILMDKDLTFLPQHAQAIATTKAKASCVLRTFSNHKPDFMKVMWRTLIQPHSDYCCQLWAPSTQIGQLKAREAPLRAFSKRTSGLYDVDYWTRLKVLQLSSIQ